MCVYADNRKSHDLVQVRGELYYSSVAFFLLQLEQACSVLPPSVAPVTNAGFLQGRAATESTNWAPER
jgi:hypothetical protein